MSEFILFANGELLLTDASSHLQLLRSKQGYVLCADGGANHAVAVGIVPNEVIGDLDSISPETRTFLIEKGIEITQHPTDKDASDLELALGRAVELGASEVTLLGALGGRLDHLLFNLQLFTHDDFNHLHFTLLSDESLVRCVRAGSRYSFSATKGDMVSLLPLTDKVQGVSSKGLLYSLSEHELRKGSSLSLSNQASQEQVQISVQVGDLLVIHMSGN